MFAKAPYRLAALFACVAVVACGLPAYAQNAPPPVAPGAIPADFTIDVTGAPAADPATLDAALHAELERRIRPTLQPGAAFRLGAMAPWPLPPLAAGARSAASVNVTITPGDPAAPIVNGSVTVTFANDASARRVRPQRLILSDDPEYIAANGVAARARVSRVAPARLYYYHSLIGLPRALDVVLTADAPVRVQLAESSSGPDQDVLAVGHAVSRDLLLAERGVQGRIVAVRPGEPFIVRHALLLQGEVVAGALDLAVVDGAAVNVAVVASSAGARPDAALAAPRLPFDGHNRHGIFDIAAFGALEGDFTVGGADGTVRYGGRENSPVNVEPGDPGRDLGDYGVVHRISFRMRNPSDDAAVVYLYHKPLGGPARAAYLVDGTMRELGCARVANPYWVATYALAPHSVGVTTVETMPDGGSFFPVEFGVSMQRPIANTPPPGSPDACGAPPAATTAAH